MIAVGLSLLVLTLVAPAQPTPTPDVERLLADASAELENEERALTIYEQILAKDPRHHDALWNASFRVSTICARRNFFVRRGCYKKARDYAERAVTAWPKSADAHFALAVVLARTAEVSAPQEAVASAKAVHHHAAEAVRLDPRHARAWYVLGKWYDRVAGASRLEREIARVLYGGIPEGATFEKSVRAFEKSVEYMPTNVVHLSGLAHAYAKHGRTDDARRTIQRGLALTPRTPDEQIARAELRDLLDELDG